MSSRLWRKVGGTVLRFLAVIAVSAATPAHAGGFGAYLTEAKPAEVFPQADRFGPFEGRPPAAAAYKHEEIIGYVFETSDIGYSGKPIRIIAGLDTKGVFTGAKVIEHHEPILLVGISPEKLFDFVARYTGRSIIEMAKGGAAKEVDVISGATVTAVVINDGLMRSALAVAKSRGIAGFTSSGSTGASGVPASSTVTTLNRDLPFKADTWATLLGNGSVRRLHLLNRDVDEAFKKIGVGSPEPYAKAGVPEQDFINLHMGLFNIETIGRSLLEDADYNQLAAWLGPDRNALIIASNGDYGFRGSGFVRGGIFDRIQLVQGDQTILFKDKDHRRVDHLRTGLPEFREIGVFRIPENAAFDPVQEFRLELLAQRPTGPIEKAFTSFALSYRTPDRYLRTETVHPQTEQAVASSEHAPATDAAVRATEAPPLWQKIWLSRAVDIGILAAALGLLTLIFFFQDWLVRNPKIFERVRIGFLLFSVLWLGFYAKAQLSVVNVLTFVNSVISGFRWETFLLDPLIFILWCAVAASLLFWGRGAFCGWLCPFGSLQELMNKAARRLGIQQRSVPFYIHERAWALKYVIFLGIFGISLGDMATAEQFAEVEPFKTVVLLHFMRDWWFVLFALALLGAGLFIERFYCRYLCVLGAALAIPGRGRMFDWLKRRKQCGFECQLCAKECMVQAIHPLGQINPHECLYCMHCQVVYWDDHKCPPLIMKRERRGKKHAPLEPAPPPVKVTYKPKEKVNVKA